RSAQSLDPRASATGSAGHEKRGLGQAVARIETRLAKAANGELPGEGLKRRGLDRFRARPRQSPATEIELGQNRVRYMVDAELIAEVGPATGVASEPADGAQPPFGTLHEGLRRHESHAESRVHRLQNGSDEAHVVIMRKPAHADGPGIEPHC